MGLGRIYDTVTEGGFFLASNSFLSVLSFNPFPILVQSLARLFSPLYHHISSPLFFPFLAIVLGVAAGKFFLKYRCAPVSEFCTLGAKFNNPFHICFPYRVKVISEEQRSDGTVSRRSKSSETASGSM